MFSFSKLRENTKRGFTLFEMMISVSIFVLITVIGVLNYSKFGSDIFINNLAYDIALSVRKAQAYGINVKGSAGDFSYAYGVHFDVNSTAAQKTYEIFVDKVGGSSNGYYNGGAEDLEAYTLLKNSRVVNLCTKRSNGNVRCAIPVDSQGILANDFSSSVLDITFRRPNPDARIKVHFLDNYSYTNACVYIRSSDNRYRQIVVYSVGSIAVVDAESGVGCGVDYTL